MNVEKQIDATTNNAKIQPEDEADIEYVPPYEIKGLIDDTSETPITEPVDDNESVESIEPVESVDDDESELSVDHTEPAIEVNKEAPNSAEQQLAIKKTLDESLEPIIDFFTEAENIDQSKIDEQKKCINAFNPKELAKFSDDMYWNKDIGGSDELEKLSISELNLRIEAADSIKQKATDILGEFENELNNDIEPKIADLKTPLEVYKKGLEAYKEENHALRILHKYKIDELQVKYDLVSAELDHLEQRKSDLLEEQKNTDAIINLDYDEIISNANDAIEKQASKKLQNIYSSYLNFESSILENTDIKADLNESYLQTKIIPNIDKITAEVPKTEISKFIELARAALNLGAVQTHNNSTVENNQIENRAEEISDFYYKYDNDSELSSVLEIEENGYYQDNDKIKQGYDAILELLVKNNLFECIDNLSKTVANSNCNPETKKTFETFISEFGPDLFSLNQGFIGSSPINISEIDEDEMTEIYLNDISLLRWDTIKNYPGIKTLFGEGSFSKMEEVIQKTTLDSLLTKPEETDESLALSNRMLLFKNAEAAPYVVMNFWRESVGKDVDEKDVYQYVESLPEPEIEKLRQMNLPGIMEVIDSIKANPDTFYRRFVANETSQAPIFENPVKKSIEQNLTKLAADLINNGDKSQQYYCMGLLKKLEYGDLGTECYQKIANLLEDDEEEDEDIHSAIIDMMSERDNDKQIALIILGNLDNYDYYNQDKIKGLAPALLSRFMGTEQDPEKANEIYKIFSEALNKTPEDVKTVVDFVSELNKSIPSIIYSFRNSSSIEEYMKISKIPDVIPFISELSKYGYRFNINHADIIPEMMKNKDDIISGIAEVKKIDSDFEYDIKYITDANIRSRSANKVYIYDPFEQYVINVDWESCLTKLYLNKQKTGEYNQRFTDGIIKCLRFDDKYVDNPDKRRNISDEDKKLFYQNIQKFAESLIKQPDDDDPEVRIDDVDQDVLTLLARRPADVDLAIELQKNGQSLLHGPRSEECLDMVLSNEENNLKDVSDLNFILQLRSRNDISFEKIFNSYDTLREEEMITRENRQALFDNKYLDEFKEATGDDFEDFFYLYIDAIRFGVVDANNRQDMFNIKQLVELKNATGEDFDSIIDNYIHGQESKTYFQEKLKRYNTFIKTHTIFSDERLNEAQKVAESNFGKAVTDLITDKTERDKIIFDYACFREHLEVNKQNFIIKQLKEQSITDAELITAFEYLRWLPDSDIAADDNVNSLSEKYNKSQESLRTTFDKVFPNSEQIVNEYGLLSNVNNLINGLSEICGILKLETREVVFNNVTFELPVDFVHKFSALRRTSKQEGKKEPRFIPELVGYLIDQTVKNSTAYTIEDLMYNQIGDTEDYTGRRREQYDGEELLGAMEDNIEASLTTWFNAINYQNEQPDSPLFVIANERTGPADVAAEFLPKEFADEHKIFQNAQYDKFYDWFQQNEDEINDLYIKYRRGEDAKAEIPADILSLLGIGPNKIIPIYQLKIPSSLSRARTDEPTGVEEIVTFLKFVSIMGGRSMFMDESTREAPRSIECLYNVLSRRDKVLGGVKMRVFGKIKDVVAQHNTTLTDTTPETPKMEIGFIDPWPNPDVKSVTDDSEGFVPEINGSCGVIRVEKPSFTSVSPYGIGTLQSLWKQFIANEVSARYEGFKDSDQKKFKKEDFKKSRAGDEEILSQDELKEKAFEKPYKALVIDLDGTVSSTPEKYNPAILERIKQLSSDEIDVVIGAAYKNQHNGSIKLFIEQLGELSDTQKSHIHFAIENGASIASLSNIESLFELKPPEEEVTEDIFPILTDILNPDAKAYKEPGSLVIRNFTPERKQEFIDKINEQISNLGLPVAISSESTKNILIRVQNATKRNIIEWLEKQGVNLNDIAKIGNDPDGNDKYMLIGRGAFNVGTAHDNTSWTIRMNEHGGGPEETEKLLEKLSFSK